MAAVRLTLLPRAIDALAGLASELRPAVMEQMSRLAADHGSCSRPSYSPVAVPGRMVSGLWCRHPGGSPVELVEIVFDLVLDGDELKVRNVLVTRRDRLPDWHAQPAEWAGPEFVPWPVVDL